MSILGEWFSEAGGSVMRIEQHGHGPEIHIRDKDGRIVSFGPRMGGDTEEIILALDGETTLGTYRSSKENWPEPKET